MKEIWKPIKDFPDYKISNLGRVKTLKRRTQQLMTQMVKPNKYLCINLMRECKMYQFTIHRLVALTFIPNPNNLPCVNHIDGDRQNNNVTNLEWVSSRRNVTHYHENNTDKKTVDIVGVHNYNGAFVVSFGIGKLSLNLGSYVTKEQAGEVYQTAITLLEKGGVEGVLAYKKKLKILKKAQGYNKYK